MCTFAKQSWLLKSLSFSASAAGSPKKATQVLNCVDCHFCERDTHERLAKLWLQHLPTNMAVSLSKETRDKIRNMAGIDEDRIQEGVKLLKDWLELQPHLPHDYGKYSDLS